MMYANHYAPRRRADYFEVGNCVFVEFDADAKPSIVWNHIDGPLLYLRNATIHWLTLWERFQCWVGWADAYSLERKHAPDFVDRWEARVQAERAS